jgi:hypothetical protein
MHDEVGFDVGVKLLITALEHQLMKAVTNNDDSGREGAIGRRGGEVRAAMLAAIDKVKVQLKVAHSSETGMTDEDTQAQSTSCLHVAVRKFARSCVDGDKVKVCLCSCFCGF